MSANERQVGGSHYGGLQIQHWDWVESYALSYFQGQITKYTWRHQDKNKRQDLDKAIHFAEKAHELKSKIASFVEYDHVAHSMTVAYFQLDKWQANVTKEVVRGNWWTARNLLMEYAEHVYGGGAKPKLAP